MTNEWDEFASDWDNPDTRRYAGLAFDSLTKSVIPSLHALADWRVLDFGCGTGLLTEKLAPHCAEIVAVDTSQKMIDTLREKAHRLGLANVTPLRAEIAASEHADHAELSKPFQLIIASSVCSFLPDYPRTLRDLGALLAESGCFVQWDWQDDMPEERIRDAFQSSGLTASCIRTAFDFDMGSKRMPVIIGTAIRQF